MSIREVLIRFAYGVQRDCRYKCYDWFVKNLKIPKDKMKALQKKLISELINHAYNHTKYYRQLMDNNNLTIEDISCIEDLKKMPVLTKSIIRNNINNLFADNFKRDDFIEVTSGGSTGNQALVYHSRYFNQMSRAASLRNNLIAKWKPEDKSVWLWGAPYEHHQVNESFISRLGILVNRRLLFNAYNYSVDDFDRWVERISRFAPTVLYGYATIILEFARFLLKKNIKLLSIKCVISTTETLIERETIEKAFNCNVYDQYGCREILAIAIESEKGVMRIADDNVALNIYENGEIILTALHSFGFPLINYKVGDYGKDVQVKNLEDDLLPFSSLNLTIGRTTENFISKNRRLISSSALSTYMSTFKLSVREQQVIQNNYTDFTIRCIVDNGFEIKRYEEIMYKVLREYFGNETTIKFEIVNKIPLEKSGKKLMFKRMFDLD